ncbi:RNA polymerase sigma factor [Nesterenkonia salmonea]|nr:RNA polymerase sigma factor [Nesterenkonia salmonea]
MDAGERLHKAVQEGDPFQAEEVINQLHPRMIRFARTLVPTKESAEDVVQESWITVLKKVPDYEGRSEFSTWVLGIVRNKSRTFLQKEQRLRENEESQMESDPLETRFHESGPKTGHWAEPPLNRFLPEYETERAELMSQLESAMATLPAVQRQVTILRDVEGLKPGEVEYILGISTDYQRKLLYRAREKLRSTLENYIMSQRTKAASFD